MIVSSVGGDSSPVTSTYWKPWNVNRGSQVSSPAAADIRVRDAGLAEVGGVDRAVGIEPLGEPQGDLLARLAVRLQPRHAGEVLAHVEHLNAGLRLGDRLRLELGEGAHRRARDATGPPDSARRR